MRRRDDPLPVRPLAVALLIGMLIGVAIGHYALPRPGARCCDGAQAASFDWSRLPCPVPGHRDR